MRIFSVFNLVFNSGEFSNMVAERGYSFHGNSKKKKKKKKKKKLKFKI